MLVCGAKPFETTFLHSWLCELLVCVCVCVCLCLCVYICVCVCVCVFERSASEVKRGLLLKEPPKQRLIHVKRSRLFVLKADGDLMYFEDEKMTNMRVSSLSSLRPPYQVSKCHKRSRNLNRVL